MAAAIADDTSVLWIANPNNPTGTRSDNDELLGFARDLPPEVLLVVDEAQTTFSAQIIGELEKSTAVRPVVVPRDEVDHWVDLPADLAAHLFAVSHRIADALRNAFPCERVGLIIAGYEVNHCHIHLVPTTDMSQLSFANAAAGIERSTLEANAARIVAALA